MKQPLKRHIVLQPISRQHHQSLLLCWKIKKGLDKDVSITRISAYLKAVWESDIKPHFKKEEVYVFPILGADHPLVGRALMEHEQLEILFDKKQYSRDELFKMSSFLESHIRFEERTLFTEIQRVATKENWALLAEQNQGEACEMHWDDKFWAS